MPDLRRAPDIKDTTTQAPYSLPLTTADSSEDIYYAPPCPCEVIASAAPAEGGNDLALLLTTPKELSSARAAPAASLSLERVIGYNGFAGFNNAHYVCDTNLTDTGAAGGCASKVVYPAAGVAVVHDIRQDRQQVFTGGTGPVGCVDGRGAPPGSHRPNHVLCLDYHPGLRLAATGGRGYRGAAVAHIWPVDDPDGRGAAPGETGDADVLRHTRRRATALHAPPAGRAVINYYNSIKFNPQGTLLLAVGRAAFSVVSIYSVSTGSLLAYGTASQSILSCGFATCLFARIGEGIELHGDESHKKKPSPFYTPKYRGASSDADQSETCFVTVGSNVSLWKPAEPEAGHPIASKQRSERQRRIKERLGLPGELKRSASAPYRGPIDPESYFSPLSSLHRIGANAAAQLPDGANGYSLLPQPPERRLARSHCCGVPLTCSDVVFLSVSFSMYHIVTGDNNGIFYLFSAYTKSLDRMVSLSSLIHASSLRPAGNGEEGKSGIDDAKGCPESRIGPQLLCMAALKYDQAPRCDGVVHNDAGERLAIGASDGCIYFIKVHYARPEPGTPLELCIDAIEEGRSKAAGSGGDGAKPFIIDLNVLESATRNDVSYLVATVKALASAPGRLLVGTSLGHLYDIDISSGQGNDYSMAKDATYDRGIALRARTIVSGHWANLRPLYAGTNALYNIGVRLAMHPSQMEFVSVGEDATARLWSLQMKGMSEWSAHEGPLAVKETRRRYVRQPATRCCYSSDGKLIAIGHANGAFSVLTADLTAFVQRIKPLDQRPKLPCSALVHPYHYCNNSTHMTSSHVASAMVNEISFSPNNKYLLVARNKFIEIYDVPTWRRLCLLEGHSATVVAADWAVTSDMVQSCGADRDLLYHALVPEKDSAIIDAKTNGIAARRVAATDGAILRVNWATHGCAVGPAVEGLPGAGSRNVVVGGQTGAQEIITTGGIGLVRCCRSYSHRLIATVGGAGSGADGASFHIYRYPCLLPSGKSSGLTTTGKQDRSVPGSILCYGHAGRTTDASWSYDDTLLVTSDCDNCIMLWRVAQQPSPLCNAAAMAEALRRRQREAGALARAAADPQLLHRCCHICGRRYTDDAQARCPACLAARRHRIVLDPYDMAATSAEAGGVARATDRARGHVLQRPTHSFGQYVRAQLRMRQGLDKRSKSKPFLTGTIKADIPPEEASGSDGEKANRGSLRTTLQRRRPPTSTGSATKAQQSVGVAFRDY